MMPEPDDLPESPSTWDLIDRYDYPWRPQGIAPEPGQPTTLLGWLRWWQERDDE